MHSSSYLVYTRSPSIMYVCMYIFNLVSTLAFVFCWRCTNDFHRQSDSRKSSRSLHYSEIWPHLFYHLQEQLCNTTSCFTLHRIRKPFHSKRWSYTYSEPMTDSINRRTNDISTTSGKTSISRSSHINKFGKYHTWCDQLVQQQRSHAWKKATTINLRFFEIQSFF